MVYQWKKCSFIKADANVAGQMCEELSSTVGLTAKTLLNANRSEDAPLHNEFEWDNEKASELYRESQSRHIINCLCICAEPTKSETKEVRAFFTLEKSVYEPLSAILSVTEKRDALLEQAKKELNTFKQKYSTLKELKPIFEAINNMEETNE